MSMSRGKRIWIGLAAVALAAMSLGAVAAPAEDVTVDSYAAKAEPICRKNTNANKKIFKGVRKMVQRNQLGKAAKRFKRAGSSLAATIRQLRALPQPPGEEARLAKWLKYLGIEKSLLFKIGKALGKGNKFQAQSLIVRLRRNSNFANNTVLAYEFNFCKIDPSRFT